LDALEKKGFIRRDRYKYRSIELTDSPIPPFIRAVNVPVLGQIAAGTPILAEENIEDSFPLPMDLVGEGEDVFMLRVKGDSMINAGIFDGDLVAVRQQKTAANGEIVAAMIENEATVKRFYRDPTRFRLVAENPAYEPILTEQCDILGRVILSIRRF
ncbi:MAG: transcriptional repressor LexA, partial [Armatimonadetes bacterium]|nr:transcriptional repressor LexA [Armatimonadota bacterium]